MSGILQNALDILISPPRGFGGIVPDVVIQESHSDNLAITEHPVEMGAPISDHAYLRPAEVKVRAAWSPNSPALGGILGTIIPVSQGLVSGISQLFNGGESYLNEIYQQLLALQESREPFELTTGKRTYEQMLIESIAVETDQATENVLMVSIHFRQVIIVKTVTASATPQAEEEAQAAPEETTAPESTGEQTPVEAPPSAAPEAPPAAAAPQPSYAAPTPDWNSPTGWRNSAGVPVERSGAPQAPPIR